MPTLWITYAWADNASGDIDFIAQELGRAGIQIKLDRWNIQAGRRLWEQIESFIASKDQSDGWLLVATQNSLASEPCKEEFAYALDRALNSRGQNFPVIGLFLGATDKSLIPAGIRTRLYVSLTDPDWKERIASSLEGRAPNVARTEVPPYSLTIHRGHPSGKVIVEVRPRAGQWSPVFAAVPIGEREKTKPWLFVEASGSISGTGMVAGPIEQVTKDGNWWWVCIHHQATPIQSLYVWLDQLPSKLAFGVADGTPQFQVDISA